MNFEQKIKLFIGSCCLLFLSAVALTATSIVLSDQACLDDALVAASNGPYQFNCTIVSATSADSTANANPAPLVVFRLTDTGNCIRVWKQSYPGVSFPLPTHSCWGVHAAPCDGELSLIYGLEQSSYCLNMRTIALANLLSAVFIALILCCLSMTLRKNRAARKEDTFLPMKEPIGY